MKNLTLSLLFLGLFSGLSAQYVTIPDANFRNRLIQLYPSCFNANQQMDTTCSGVVNSTILYAYGLQISDLQGVQYFDRLTDLFCYNNQLTSLPILPSTLTRLYCNNNQLMSLPVLPSQLYELICNNNMLSTLPSLPNTLTNLRCDNNRLTALPTLPSTITDFTCNDNQLTSLPVLPPRLRYLHCHNNLLTSLPSNLPSGLYVIYCQNNRLTSLPALSQSYIQRLDCSNNQLTSLPPFFNDVRQINCSGNRLTSLPTLPGWLSYLNCSNNQLTSLPQLPLYIEELRCDSNQLTSIQPLPADITILTVSNNQLTSIPSLSVKLRNLNCATNAALACLPSLPDSLRMLNVLQTQITCLPNYTTSVTQASTGLGICTNPSQICYNPGRAPHFVVIPDRFLRAELIGLAPACFNQLGEMDTTCVGVRSIASMYFPDYFIGRSLEGIQYLDGLREINISNNGSIIHIPAYPAGLKRFSYKPMWGGGETSFLTILPSQLNYLELGTDTIDTQLQLPIGLDSFVVRYAWGVSQLPQLPNGLSHLGLKDNRFLNCLPNMPDSLRSMDISNTGIICLPRYNQFINQQTSNLPVCGPTSPGCIGRSTAVGTVYNDANMNGFRDPSEGLVPNVPIYVSSTDWTTISSASDSFNVLLFRLPNVNVITPSTNIPYRGFSPASYSVTTTNFGLVPNSYDFAMQVTQPNVTDLVTHMSTWFIRPGFQTSANINVENIGTINQTNASISLEIPNGLTVITVTPANGVVTGNTVTWSGESIAIFEKKSYSVGLQVPATMPLGTSLTYTAQATPANTDFTPADNIVTETVVVRGSYDPNDKQVNKERLPNNYVAADEEMLYTIRFQNTGTDTAFTVLVRDTLDLQKLDFSTFRVTGASHALRTNVREQGVLEFVFNNINLPDSFVNEPLSHGYVQFRIHPKANLPLGTQIKNRAFIYFDFNSPIITNFATTTVGLLSVNSAELGTGSLSLYPVPVSEQLTVNFNAVKSCEVRYRLLDLQGRVLQEQQISVVEGENISTMDMSRLGAGMYVLQVVGEQGSVSQKVIKE